MQTPRTLARKETPDFGFLRRLKLLGGSEDTLLDIYKLFCRSVLEYGAPVWTLDRQHVSRK
jgi:hypothetical protein